MAINIAQQPTTPNCTYTNLVYQVTSSNATEPQFQYVMDVYVSGSATRLARIRQFPNQLNQAVFDPSRIMNDNLEYSTLLTPTVTYVVNDVTDTIKTFDVQFGEEYGTSATSSVTLYPNLSNDIIEVFPCQIDPNNGTSFNFLDSGSAVILSDRPDGVPEYIGAGYRIPFYNGTAGALNVTSPTAGTVAVQPGDITSVGQTVVGTDGQDLTFTFNGQSITRTFKDACNYPIYNFLFVNKYGMYENFSTSKPVRGNVSVSRQNYKQTFVNYGGDPSYDVKRRGETNYNTSITEDLTIATDWLTQSAAEWITQLIESDQVFVAVSPNNTTFKPIVITNASYVQNTGRKDQKVFNYDITFRYANQRRGR